MIKNCGDYVHLQVAERNILQEMIKIVRKKVSLLSFFSKIRCHSDRPQVHGHHWVGYSSGHPSVFGCAE